MTDPRRRNRRLERRWAGRDAALAILFAATLFGGVVHPPLIAVAFVMAVAFLAFLGIRHLRRAHRWRTRPPGEFWADRLKD